MKVKLSPAPGRPLVTKRGNATVKIYAGKNRVNGRTTGNSLSPITMARNGSRNASRIWTKRSRKPNSPHPNWPAAKVRSCVLRHLIAHIISRPRHLAPAWSPVESRRCQIHRSHEAAAAGCVPPRSRDQFCVPSRHRPRLSQRAGTRRRIHRGQGESARSGNGPGAGAFFRTDTKIAFATRVSDIEVESHGPRIGTRL
jgi:hypothetical protein